MKLAIAFFISILICSNAVAKNPNYILVFIDDMGWGDFSCFGNEHAKTPNIDKLAYNGIRFEQFYVNSPICSPSRTAISTGQYPQRWKITSYLSRRKHNEQRGMAQWLDLKAPMLARILNNNGYSTGHFGKWHMGGQRDVDDAPEITEYGFDRSLTNFEGMGPKLLPLTLKPNQKEPGRIWSDAERLGEGFRWMLRSKITEGFVDEAIPFIKESVKNDKPFYINLWPDDVHAPFWPPTDKWADSKKDLYLSVLQEMDNQLGKLFNYIRNSPELKDNTLIMVCSDNGPEKGAGVAGPFRGYKTHLYEGGVRSSLVVWGPGIVKKSGYVNKKSVFSAIDLVPSLLDISGLQIPNGISFDGESLVDVLLGGSEKSRKAPLYFRRPPDRDSFYGDKDLPDLAMREGRWKLLCEYDGTDSELYDLDNDLGETKNVADQNAGILKKMKNELISWHKSMPEDNGAKLVKVRKNK